MIVDKALIKRIHTATADAMHQIVIDMIDLEALERLIIHLLRLLETPKALVLVRHLSGDIIFFTGMSTECITREHLRLATHIHGRCIEVVYAMFDGIIYQLVYLLLIVRQSHHAKTKQRDLLARTMLYTIGHTANRRTFLFILSKCTQRAHYTRSHSHACAHTNTAQKVATTHVSFFLHHHSGF